MSSPVDAGSGTVSRLQKIWGTATVHGGLDGGQVDTLAELVKERCPVANMVVASGCEVDIVWQPAAAMAQHGAPQ